MEYLSVYALCKYVVAMKSQWVLFYEQKVIRKGHTEVNRNEIKNKLS